MPFGFDPGQFYDPTSPTGFRQPTPRELEELQEFSPPLGHVMFATEQLEVVAVIMGAANPTGGYGGFEVVPRPKRVGLTEWVGRDPLGLGFTIMFDGLARKRSVERPIRQLERLAGLQRGGPAELQLLSAGVIPHDFTHAPDKSWVIDDIQWGDSIRRVRDGRRIRQLADVTLLEFVEDEQLAGLPAVMKAAVKGEARSYTDARAGESLRDVAKRTRRPLADLKKLNDIRDGDRTLKTGRRIKLK